MDVSIFEIVGPVMIGGVLGIRKDDAAIKWHTGTVLKGGNPEVPHAKGSPDGMGRQLSLQWHYVIKVISGIFGCPHAMHQPLCSH